MRHPRQGRTPPPSYLPPTQKTRVDRVPITREIGELLDWLQKRWAPVGALALALPVIYTYHYAVDGNVPLDVASRSLIVTYPAMLALLIFLAMVLLVVTLLPAVVLLTPLTKSGNRLIDPLTQSAGVPAESRRWLVGWTASQIMYLAWLWVALLIGSQEWMPEGAGWQLSLAVAVFALALSLSAFLLYRI